MAYRPFNVDRDLLVDRTRTVVFEDIILKVPEKIQIGGVYEFKIENYNPEDEYLVSFSRGSWDVDYPKIIYRAPRDYFGELKLIIKQKKIPSKGWVIFEDGTVYNEEGLILKAKKWKDCYYVYIEDPLIINFEDQKANLFFHFYINYLKTLEEGKIDPLPFPIKSKRKQEPPIDIKNFKIFEKFGYLNSKKINDELRKFKKRKSVDYYLPSEYNKLPNETLYLYRTINKNDEKNFSDKKYFLAVPRNSNITESDGDVFKGYRKPGDVGGSLTIKENKVDLEKIFEWNFEIDLDDLSAILPDQILAVCLPTVSIQPVLRGLPLGHTFWWELIKGDQATITWLTPRDQKDVIIELGDRKSDRIFRFWISKGTKYEKYYDVYIYGTPTDKVKNGPHVGMCPGVEQNHLNIKIHETGPVLLSYYNIFNKQLRLKIRRNY